MSFLNHFQLPIHYDIGTKLFSTFWQDKATPISDHIQEWRRWKSWLKPLYHQNFSLSGSSSRCYLTLRRMFLHSESKTRNTQSLWFNSWIWSTLNLDFCMRLYLMLRDLVSIPRSSLDHMPMELWVVQVPNLWIRLWKELWVVQVPKLWIRLWNKWANCILINPLWESHGFVSTHPNDECNFCTIIGPKGKLVAWKE